tara:strand:+ start:298 stop:552 length:255 start_codon:yes stop_codon:yes gene_type:complete
MENLKTIQLKNGNIQPMKMWITFLHADFENSWIPLTDWNNVQIFAQENNNDFAKKIAREKFDSTSFGLADCEQKKLGNAMWNNF